MTPPVNQAGEPVVNEALAVALGLTASEYRVIVKRVGRTPTYTELGMFSVMWSEHCSYKHSRRIIRQYPTKGPTVLQGPGENAGGVRVDKNIAVLLKIESHNHPSMVEPYQGAATGVGGILRDIFTMGARPVAIMDSLRFGPLDNARTKRIFAGVVSGIGGYGNCIGIPTVGGELDFDPSFSGNCLVNAMAVGVIDPKDLTKSHAKGEGNLVVYMGAATGRDGIHGASLLASQGFGGAAKKQRDHAGGISAVQVADPFLGKLLMEASIDLCRQKLLVGMQDMGAAGLSCSTCEMSSKGASGMDVNLDLVPQRAAGMTSYEMMLSESQERMLMVVEPRKWKAVKAAVGKYGIPLVVIGKVRKGNRVRLWRHGKLIVDVPSTALTDDVPMLPFPRPARLTTAPAPRLRPMSDPGAALLNLLATPGLGSKRRVWKRYDHMVRTNNVILPGSDAAVLRLEGSSNLIAFSVDGPSRLVAADAFAGGQLAIAESARNVACAGARPVAFTNGLNFPNPDRPGNLWQFAEVVRGISTGARKLGTPVVSGNVSFYNEHEAKGILPTPMIGMLGVLEGWRPVVQWFSREGDVIVALGGRKASLNASVYQEWRAGRRGGRPAPVVWPLELGVHKTLVAAARLGLTRSAHDLAEGGLLVALAECCVSGTDASVPALGCAIDLTGPADATTWFGEGPSRVLVSLGAESLDAFKRAAGSTPWRVIGRVGGDALSVRVDGRERVRVPVARLIAEREKPLARILA